MDQDTHLRQLNGSSLISPPVTYNYASLPLDEIPWDQFEELCFRLICHLHGIENCSTYGTVGQNQHGIDHFVRMPDSEHYIVYQAKRNASFTKKDLLKAIKIWEEGKWHSKSKEFVLISTNHLRDTTFLDEFEIQKKRLLSQGIILNKIGSHELNILLRELPAIVEEFFKKEWMERFCSVAALIKYLDGHVPNIDFEKKEYAAVQYYIPRKVTKPNIENEPFSVFHSRYTILLSDYVKECITKSTATRLILKAEAASGKSKELEQIAHVYSNNDYGIYPVLIRLKNFHGDLGQYVCNFYPNWQDIPSERLLLLFDGLDEIPSAQFKDFVNRFNIFLQANQNTHIIASIRTNVFTREINNGIDSAGQLLEMYLGEITELDVKNYLKARITDDRQRKTFEAFARKKWVKAILFNPFYLNALTDLFLKDSDDLPIDKVDLIERITYYKLGQDKEKFGDELPLSSLLAFSDNLSLFLTLTGKNAIDETALSQFTNLSINDIKRCSLFKIEEHGLWNTIQFEHNNFQEYLSAKKLSKLSWVQLEPILFHTCGVHMLKPKMLNTASYLFTILDVSNELFVALFNKIKDTKISYLLQFERDKTLECVRLSIFREIILKGKSDEIYYLNDDYRPEELSEFVNYSSDGFDFLINQLEIRGGENHIYSILDLIYTFKQSAIRAMSKKRLLKNITKLILEKDHPFAVYDRAIDVMTKYRFFESKLVKMVKQCPLINHKMVRGAVIKYIDEGNFDGEFNYVLQSNLILTKSDYKVMAGLETLYLTYIHNHLDESNAVSVLQYFSKQKDHIKELTRTASYQEENRPVNRIYERLAAIFVISYNEDILTSFINFLIEIHYSVYKKDKWGNPAIFFRNISQNDKFFWMILLHPQIDRIDHFLAELYFEKLDIQIFEAYKRSEITDKQIITIRCSLASQNSESHNHFQKQLLANFGDTFKYKEHVNWDEINVQRQKRDLELLQSREEFLIEAQNLYSLIHEIKGGEAEEEHLYELEYSEKKEVRKRVNNTLILRTISEYEIKGGLDAFVSCFDSEGWDWYVFQAVEQLLVSRKTDTLPKKLLSFTESYFEEKIFPHINFREAVKDTDEGSYTINSLACHLLTYYRSGAISVPENMQLDMLFLDYDGYARYPETDEQLPMKLYEIIHASTDSGKFKNRVLSNITDKKLSARVLTSNSAACLQYQYDEALPALLTLLERKNFPPRFKEKLVEIIMDLSGDAEVFEGCIRGWKSIRHPWQLAVVKHLAKLSSHEPRLVSLIESSNLKPFFRDAEHFWKHELLVMGIRLGSMKVANFQFHLFASKLKTFDFSPLKVGDFKRLIKDQPDFLLTQAFQTLEKYAPYIKDGSHNELAELMEELIRSSAITSQTRFELAIAKYEDIICRYRVQNSQITRIKWYERKLITDFYAEACSYESEHTAWELINKLMH